MIEYDGEDYEVEYDPDDCCPPKEEPDCGGCNDSGWRRPYGIVRRVLARVLPLCVVWWQWNGLLARWGTSHGSWPCDGCNPCWIDTWWLPTQLRRLRWWWWQRRRKASGNYDDEAPF